MSHLVNPSGFRPGKVFLWSNNAASLTNNKQTALDNNVNLALGLESVVNKLLRRNNYWAIKSTTKFDSITGVAKLKVLYYPLVSPLLRKSVFPTYCAPRNLLSKVGVYTKPFKTVMAKIWTSKSNAFINRFIRSKPRPNLNKIVKKAMFRGTKLFRGFKKHSRINNIKSGRVRKYLKNKFVNYRTKKNRLMRWRLSKNVLALSCYLSSLASE